MSTEQKNCIKYPSIDQLRTAIKHIKTHESFDGLDEDGKAKYKPVANFPTVEFYGTVKIHGTNAAFRQDCHDGEILFQSRERVIDPVSDNAGYASHFYHKRDKIQNMLEHIRKVCDTSADTPVIVYGEWAGNGIQKGVAVNELPKRFYVFGCKIIVDGVTHWFHPYHEFFQVIVEYCIDDCFGGVDVESINRFETFKIAIDVNQPEIAQNEIVELVKRVEAQCPVGKYYGVNGIGEGIVFTGMTAPYEGLMMKCKGSEHSASKVKTVASVDVERIASVRDLVSVVVTENRMRQMFDSMDDHQIERTIKNTGQFIKLVMADCFKEELDTITENGISGKEFAAMASPVIVKFYHANIDG